MLRYVQGGAQGQEEDTDDTDDGQVQAHRNSSRPAGL